MKSIVVYFSQTGNTAKVAKAIRDGIKAAAGHCELAALENVDPQTLADFDLIGLGCPTFARKEPVNVRAFIKGLGRLTGRHAFIFSTHGGHPGNVMFNMARGLRGHGLTVIGGFNCDGDDHMPHYTWPWFTAGHPDGVDLKASTGFGKEMAHLMQRILQGETVRLPIFRGVPSNDRRRLKRGQVNRPRSRGFEFKMTLDRKKCLHPGCALCADHCPVKAIDLSVDPMIFRKGCISCYFCEMICPSGAIEIDPESVKARREARVKGLLNRKYAEFFEKAKNALIGNRTTLYRMLVKKVEVGKATTFHAQERCKRPRFIIRHQYCPVKVFKKFE